MPVNSDVLADLKNIKNPDETGLDILQLQNTTSSNQVKLPKKYVKSTLTFYYENLINNKLSKAFFLMPRHNVS
jgi:hypothetical protein